MNEILQMPASDLVALLAVAIPVGICLVVIIVCSYINSLQETKSQRANREELNNVLYEIKDELSTQNHYMLQYFSAYENKNRDVVNFISKKIDGE